MEGTLFPAAIIITCVCQDHAFSMDPRWLLEILTPIRFKYTPCMKSCSKGFEESFSDIWRPVSNLPILNREPHNPHIAHPRLYVPKEPFLYLENHPHVMVLSQACWDQSAPFPKPDSKPCLPGPNIKSPCRTCMPTDSWVPPTS